MKKYEETPTDDSPANHTTYSITYCWVWGGDYRQELISRRDVSLSSVRVNVNRYGKPSEIQGAFLFPS